MEREAGKRPTGSAESITSRYPLGDYRLFARIIYNLLHTQGAGRRHTPSICKGFRLAGGLRTARVFGTERRAAAMSLTVTTLSVNISSADIGLAVMGAPADGDYILQAAGV
jgi:hypothetical protein